MLMGGSVTVDNDGIDNEGTDDQIANEVNIDDTAGNFTATEVEGALAELAASNAADNDTDPTNEIQTVGSADNSVDVVRLR